MQASLLVQAFVLSRFSYFPLIWMLCNKNSARIVLYETLHPRFPRAYLNKRPPKGRENYDVRSRPGLRGLFLRDLTIFSHAVTSRLRRSTMPSSWCATMSESSLVTGTQLAQTKLLYLGVRSISVSK